MTKTLSELIQQKEELLRRLLPISVRQLEIVRQSDLTTLLPHLARKQRLMNEFEIIEQQLVPFQNIPPEERKWNNKTEQQETSAAIDRCAVMLEEILRNDSTSMDELSVQKTEVEEQLRRVRQGSQVFSAYAKQTNMGNTKHFNMSES
ncbi:MAG: hypothetical protein LBQ50_07545 [Planctomycetaceae bacterium]|jgi:hypothetical protein|nr:hypothetical protein [Planctomycetaceae bacterium]